MLGVNDYVQSMMTGLDPEKLLQIGRAVADYGMSRSAPVRVTCVKPVVPPMKVMGEVAEGIEPLFSSHYLRHSKARMDAYRNNMCEGMWTAETRKRKRVYRTIDDTWEGG